MTKKLQQIKKLAYVTTCGPSGDTRMHFSQSTRSDRIFSTVGVATLGARQLAAADSGSEAAKRGRGALHRVSPWTGCVWRLFGPAHPAGATTDLAWCGACLGVQVGLLQGKVRGLQDALAQAKRPQGNSMA